MRLTIDGSRDPVYLIFIASLYDGNRVAIFCGFSSIQLLQMSVVHLLHGLPGTGKTTFARKLETEYGAVCLNHDEFMTTLFGDDPPAAQFQEYADRINILLWVMAGKFVAHGLDVVLDHGYWTRASRDEARTRVRRMGAIPRFYSLICPESVADARVLARSRQARPGDLIINQPALDVFRTRFEPMGNDEERIEIYSGLAEFEVAPLGLRVKSEVDQSMQRKTETGNFRPG